jgi:hypothetical protein
MKKIIGILLSFCFLMSVTAVAASAYPESKVVKVWVEGSWQPAHFVEGGWNDEGYWEPAHWVAAGWCAGHYEYIEIVTKKHFHFAPDHRDARHAPPHHEKPAHENHEKPAHENHEKPAHENHEKPAHENHEGKDRR